MMMMMMTMSSHWNLPILPLEEESLSFLLLPDKETPRFLSSFSSWVAEDILWRKPPIKAPTRIHCNQDRHRIMSIRVGPNVNNGPNTI